MLSQLLKIYSKSSSCRACPNVSLYKDRILISLSYEIPSLLNGYIGTILSILSISSDSVSPQYGIRSDVLPDFDSANANDVVGIYWQPNEYAINENFGFTMRRYFDEEANEWVDKALVIADGKVLNPLGYYLITKKSS